MDTTATTGEHSPIKVDWRVICEEDPPVPDYLIYQGEEEARDIYLTPFLTQVGIYLGRNALSGENSSSINAAWCLLHITMNTMNQFEFTKDMISQEYTSAYLLVRSHFVDNSSYDLGNESWRERKIRASNQGKGDRCRCRCHLNRLKNSSSS